MALVYFFVVGNPNPQEIQIYPGPQFFRGANLLISLLMRVKLLEAGIEATSRLAYCMCDPIYNYYNAALYGHITSMRIYVR